MRTLNIFVIAQYHVGQTPDLKRNKQHHVIQTHNLKVDDALKIVHTFKLMISHAAPPPPDVFLCSS